MSINHSDEAGKEATWLWLPPRETVHAPLSAHSLRPSRGTPLLLVHSRCSACFCRQLAVVVLLTVADFARSSSMDLLMAECMNHYQGGGVRFALCRPCDPVMDLNLFIIEEGFKAL